MKLTPSIVGSSLHGSAASITAAVTKGVQYIRRRVTPTNPNSAPQQEVRQALARLNICWGALPQDLKDQLDLLAADYAISGHNLYIRTNHPQERSADRHVVAPPSSHGPTVQGVALDGEGAGVGEILLSWDPDGWQEDDLFHLLVRPRIGAGPAYAAPWLNKPFPDDYMSQGSVDVYELTPGTWYALAFIPNRRQTLEGPRWPCAGWTGIAQARSA